MSSIRRLPAVGVVGATVLLTASVAVGSASAHGSMYGPVSRVATCYAEGPENPKSQVCKDLVASSGTQPLYDWNEVNIANADGRSQSLIPDGHLCSADRDKYRALDMARADWPATAVAAGPYTFDFRVTAPHMGVMTTYITKQGYDPTQPLKWSDLDLATPVARTSVTSTAPSGHYTFTGTLPNRTGRQLLYLVWQRTDSPEAFYSCSDIVYGQGAAPAAAAAQAAPAAPSDRQITAGYAKSTVNHHGHGGDVPAAAPAPALRAAAVGSGSTASLALGVSGLVSVAASAVFVHRRRPKAPAR
ncbi:carbohydrate-binding protein CbpC [Kitasatospora kazusensis]|uniref:Carbohydrate-binding protein CbpC n=1 Tax=Kitasatospora kazusensis TaxID=407974 RepID=A0ABN3A1Z3_9ACTN